ncbi:hypothetical protein THAOC_32039 [Thalassiosira oceanica]|uniref:Uncharacterized protein n=1 Tax=Thalassiosira oceanica TaxID=159749 RepID=K0RJT2_THAOC|nr:hypothetical protein THAOC_32039 [Thalassiosira oceanica]|eukprot:EJK49116.1 hypothetical protein THAOC_32039 [Thalassiosira oceanica]
MSLHGAPMSLDDPAIARKRARITGDAVGGAAPLNVESRPGPAPPNAAATNAGQSEMSQVQERRRGGDDAALAQRNGDASSDAAYHGQLRWLVQRERALERRKTDEVNHRRLVSLQALQEENAMLRARLEASEEEKSKLIGNHKLEVDAMRRELKDLQGSYSDALKWAYTDEIAPYEHWIEEGYPEEYADAMVELQERFEQIIKDLRMGTVGRRVVVQFDLQNEEDQRITAAHDDVLMPYWNELANAIIHWSEYHANEGNLEVIIQRIETPEAVLDVLRPAIKQSKTNQKVTGVGFYSVMRSNKEWKTICNAIRMRNAGQASVMSLCVDKCFVDGINTEMLKEILASDTEGVRLMGNGMSSREAQIIAEHLASNPSLARLGLNDNCFDDADAAMLANSLSSNTNLRYLNVSGNSEMKLNGKLAFLRAIFDVTSLAACAACNHTCRVEGLEQDISALNCYTEASCCKWEKIFAMLALSSEGSFFNLALLKDVPVSLMPVLIFQAGDQIEEGDSLITDLYLELTGTKRNGRHDVWNNLEQTRKISCVFEVVRSCVVPSLYV